MMRTEQTLGETRVKLNQVEVDCDETKYLLNEHVIVEQQLFDQASEVVRLYEASQEDNGALKGKVSQLRGLVSANRDTVDEYASTTIRSMEQMSRDEVEVRAGNELLVDSLVNSVHTESKLVVDLIDDRVRPELQQIAQNQVR